MEYNNEIKKMMMVDGDGRCGGSVCAICDKLIEYGQVKLVSVGVFKKRSMYFSGSGLDVHPDIMKHYKLVVPGDEKLTSAFSSCMLSPRSMIYYKNEKKRTGANLMCCVDCKSDMDIRKLREGKLPRFAIANGMAVGEAPECLKKLNEIEIALISRSRYRGHLFTYWGGCHRSIKGWHSMYDVDVGHTMAVLEGVEKLTDTNNVAVVLCGPFTAAQKERVMKKVDVSIDKVRDALSWLKENNVLYKDMVMPEIGKPKIILKCTHAESTNSDIESKEEISVMFPDGTVRTGGCEDGASFDEAVSELRSLAPGVAPILISKPSSRHLRDFQEKNLQGAFPLQFPYGMGGVNDLSVSCSQNGYCKHLLSLSMPSFHESCFVLTIHNMYERSKALTGAVWQVMGGHEKCDLLEEELNQALLRKAKGLPQVRSSAGDKFLNSIQSVKKNMAHTNEAAKSAQSKFLSLIHHYGCPKVLFTVSFDDSLDLRILALSQVFETNEWMNSLKHCDKDDLRLKMDELNAIRFKYPGLCCYNFDYLLDIVLDKLVGWNDKKEGIFGKFEACGVAVEEQGRKTLHAHIVVYTKDWNKTLRDLQSEREETRRKAEKEVVSCVDKVLSTDLTPGNDSVFCPSCGHDKVSFVDEQGLRYLRHRHGLKESGGRLGWCEECKEGFTGDELARARATGTTKKIDDMTEEDLKCEYGGLILSSSAAGKMFEGESIAKVNHRYNHHLTKHTRTCFKKGDEGRCNLPDRMEEKTHVMRSEEPYTHYNWCGKKQDVYNVTVRPKRKPEDAYTNSYCKAITESVAPANSNISFTTGCRCAIYSSCYTCKPTQKEDSEEGKKMATFVGSRYVEERNENALFESLSRLMGAVIVGTSEHVVSGPMAAHIVKNGSRFKFSERFQYVPMREAIDILESGNKIDNSRMSILGHKKGCFLTNQAVNYIMRPKQLEGLSMIKFFEVWSTVRNPCAGDEDKDEKKDVYDIDNSDHPGYKRQQIRKSKVRLLPQFCHWSFPDASGFGGNILEMKSNEKVNATVEKYCRSVLVLFHNYRCKEDLVVDGSYFKKFKRLYHNGVPSDIREILDNIQMFYNSARMPGREDPVKDITEQYRSPCKEKTEEDDDDMGDEHFAGLMCMWSAIGKKAHKTHNSGKEVMSLVNLRKEGARGCGFYNLPLVKNCGPLCTQSNMLSWVESNRGSKRDRDEEKKVKERDRPSQHQLMELTYHSTKRKVKVTDDDGNQKERTTIVANGTALSIVQWSQQEHLNMDEEQQLAFQIVTAAYVLTYYEDALTVLSNERGQGRHEYVSEKKKLERMARQKQLIMFLDGAGGSGKSRVVEELLKYGKEYTEKLSLVFDMRTIVVTALSGVAAVSIGGETIHSAAGLKRNISEEDRSWINARLLVVDEISFMSSNDLFTLDENLKKLMRCHKVYGGLHVLFCGDFRQLEPVSGKPLYSQKSEDKFWANSINCYVELHGLHRFKDDPEWGRILQRMRNDELTTFDIDAINKRVVDEVNVKRCEIPGNASYCVYQNVDRSAINTGVFAQALENHWQKSDAVPTNMLIVKAADVNRKFKGNKSSAVREEDVEFICENCGDSRFRTKGSHGKGHFVDPLLKLYHRMPLMLLSNEDVPNGHANGTRVLLETVTLKENVSVKTMTVDCKKCPVVSAEEVEELMCVMEGKESKEFVIRPKKMSCTVKVPLPPSLGVNGKTSNMTFTMSLKQLPLISNIATTGHKLQGQTKENLVISVWSRRRNWNYVALSRVTCRTGLFLLKKLPYDTDFSMSYELQQMNAILKRCSPNDCDFDLLNEERNALNRNKRHWSNSSVFVSQLLSLT